LKRKGGCHFGPMKKNKIVVACNAFLLASA